MGVPDAERDNIMHVSLPIGESTLMGSDVPSTFGSPVEKGSSYSISYSSHSRKESDEIFAKLLGGRHGNDGASGHVLGFVLRFLHGPVRHQLDGRLRTRGVGAVEVRGSPYAL